MNTTPPQGYAVRCGIAAARGEYILFADADGATPVAEVEKLEAELKRVLAPGAGARNACSCTFAAC